MLHFLGPLESEFGDLEQVAAAYVPGHEGEGQIKMVDPVLFQVLGVTALGHRLMLAKGVVKLNGGA